MIEDPLASGGVVGNRVSQSQAADEIEGGLLVAEKPGQWLIQARAPLEDVEAETGLSLMCWKTNRSAPASP